MGTPAPHNTGWVTHINTSSTCKGRRFRRPSSRLPWAIGPCQKSPNLPKLFMAKRSSRQGRQDVSADKGSINLEDTVIVGVWPKHYSLDIYEAPRNRIKRRHRSQGSPLGILACSMSKADKSDFLASNREKFSNMIASLKLVEVNLTLQSRHRTCSSEYIQNSGNIIHACRMPPRKSQ